MSVKTAGVGHFQIPTAPAAGVSVTSGAANVYTTTPVQLIASTAAALYITGIYAEEAAVSAATYKSVQLMVGAAAAETVIGQYEIAPSTGSTVTRTYRPIFPPIPVAAAARISAKTGDSVGALATLISLECIAQSNVVDDGITVGTVNLVNTTTTLTNLPAITANWLTAAGIAAAALNGKGDWNIGKTGYALSAAGVQAIWDALTSALTTVGSIGKLLVDNINATISSRAPSATAVSNVDYTAARAAKLDNADVATSTRLATAGYTAPLDAAGTRAAVGLALANLDTQLAAILAASGGLTAAGVRAAIGLAAANLDTQLAALDVDILTRLAAAAYTAPNNAGIATLVAALGTLTAAERNALVDAILARNIAGGSSAGRTIAQALAFMRNKWTVIGDTLTVYDVDDVTVLWTSTMTRAAGDPVSASDPV